MRLRAMYTSSMETIAEFIGFCRQGLHGTGLQSAGLPLALFLAGLAGSLVHCIGMCGPFVLGQVIADSEHTTGDYGEWQRLAGAALLPYHFGRLTTYTALGFVAGGATALFAATTGFAWLSAALLAIAAVLLLLQALGLAFGATSPLGERGGPTGRATFLIAPAGLAVRTGSRARLAALRPALWRPGRCGRHGRRPGWRACHAGVRPGNGTRPRGHGVGWSARAPPAAGCPAMDRRAVAHGQCRTDACPGQPAPLTNCQFPEGSNRTMSR